MATYNPGLEANLNEILTILGTTKTHLWPFYESAGITVSGIGVGVDLIPSETAAAAEALEDDFNPAVLPSGLYAYHFQPTGDHHLAGPDDASGLLNLELHDASASATEIAVSDSAIVLNQWQFVAATFDGTDATPSMKLYVDGVSVNDGSSVESGAFVSMEDTATPLTIGCGGVTATPTTEFHGRMALPFICGKELSADNGVSLRDIMRPMVGIS